MKLVRDRIPELAAATASPAGLVEELGDVLQVLYALAELAGHAAADIECARARKARTYGAYTRRLVWQPPPEPRPGRDTRSRRQAEPRAHPAPLPTEATR